MQQSTYYGGNYEDETKPKYPVVYYMMETYLRKKLDEAIEEFSEKLDKRISLNKLNETIKDVQRLKADMHLVKESMPIKQKISKDKTRIDEGEGGE